MSKKKISIFILFAMAVMLLCACSSSESVDSLVITSNGEEVKALKIVNGVDSPELTVSISPEDYSGEILWESSDAGVIRIASTDGRACTLSTLKSGTAKITVSCGNINTSVKVTVIKNQNDLSERETAYYINDTRYSSEIMNLYYVSAYNSFLSQYGSYATYYGLDTESGMSNLDKQSCDYSADGTWRGYFLETACSDLLSCVALCDWADENGYSLGENEEKTIQDKIDAVVDKAAQNGYENMSDYLEAIYGSSMTTELYEDYLEQVALAELAYTTYSDSLSYTDKELSDHYAQMGYDGEDNNYRTVSMRHILIKAEADEDGEYSDEAISSAHEKATEIYNEWIEEDATEESFSQLVSEYSDDTASVSTGGLYENIYKDQLVEGINDWLFSSGRKEGDTAIIDNNGSYTGTHVVLFCGTGEKYSTYLAKSDLIDTDISNWMESLMENYIVAEGYDYKNIGYINDLS